uniref:Uncharacterized protein n=1 Tax=Candidatus Kentrum sp. MB TaxID=2138164 RepID=A0A451B9K8_9GAMM|nr:MAG: hypothetical protein BECKMB1821G_GA0114241_100925 [Candidatus Kentron sp. MB]VFK27068.1 MAG: hypothetical protein BECKMB1821I_GA0114274_100227 [Candidatus Kentron sp. MB]VFK74917.1 MAG: hypothetical protein BECKMB1821H_GA0114242_101226 [Candidatus Kentron sp. MB]
MSSVSASQTNSVALGSIDRSELNVCLRPRTLIRAALTSVIVCAAVPIAALICLIAGCIALGACLILIVVLVAASYGFVPVGGVLLALAIFNQERRELFAVSGIGVGILGFHLSTVFSPWFNPIRDTANLAFAACQQVADFLYTDIFVGLYIYVWSWSVLLGALLAAAAVLVTVWVLSHEAQIKRTLLRIRYTCPAADCTYQGVPYFRCPECSTVLGDLKPTIFGVLHVRCGQCREHLLPTCDLMGRLQLEKQCPQCSVDLEHPAFGRLGEMHVVFAGASSSGKSNLMISAIRDLERAVAPAYGLRVQFTNDAEEQEFRNRCAQMDEGRVQEKTTSSANPAAFNLSIENRRGKGALMYVYDTDGSDFETEDRLLGHAFHEYTKGIVLVIDPFAERGVVSKLGLSGNGKLTPVSRQR